MPKGQALLCDNMLSSNCDNPLCGLIIGQITVSEWLNKPTKEQIMGFLCIILANSYLALILLCSEYTGLPSSITSLIPFSLIIRSRWYDCKKICQSGGSQIYSVCVKSWRHFIFLFQEFLLCLDEEENCRTIMTSF